MADIRRAAPTEPDPRHADFVKLRSLLAAFRNELRSLQRGSPEHEAVLARWEPVQGILLDLSEELGEE